VSAVTQTLHDGGSFKIIELAQPIGLRLVGRIDVAEHTVLQTAVQRFLDRTGDLYLDLTDLDFVDVGGMRILFDAAACIADAGRELVFVNPNQVTSRTIQICARGETANIRVTNHALSERDPRTGAVT
jgi:anti-anti-sigma factor